MVANAAISPSMICTGGIAMIARDLAQPLGQSHQETQFHGIADLRLMIAIGMRRRAPPLIAAELEIAVTEHALPRHEHIVEHDQRVGFVEA